MKYHSDKELLEAIGQKQTDAFNRLYEKYNKLLVSRTFHAVNHVEHTEEIMQEFWAEVWMQPSRIKCNDKGEAKGFLYNYLFYRILDFLRKESMNVIALAYNESLENVENELIYTHISEEYDIKELESVIESILKELPNQMGEVFTLLHREGYTVKETAQMLNMNERTVKYKSKHSLAVLQKVLSEQGMDAKSFKVARDVSSSVIYILFTMDKWLP